MKSPLISIRPARRRNSKGFSLVEIIIGIAALAALAIGAFVYFSGRAVTTELTSMANQVGETIRSQQQLRTKNLRAAKVSTTEFSGAVASLLQDHKYINSTTPTTAGDGTGATMCSTASGNATGFTIGLATGTGALTLAEASELQALVHTSLKNVFTDPDTSAYFATGSNEAYEEVLDVTAGKNPGELDNSAAATATLINVCLENG